MNKTSSELKAEAKGILSGRWKDAVLLNIVPSLLKILAVWSVIVVTIIALIAMVTIFANFESNSSSFRSQQVGDTFDDSDLDEWGDELDEIEDYNYSVNSDDILNNLGANTTYSFMPNGSSIFSWLFSLVISFMTIGISFTFLEVFRNPNRKIQPKNDQFRMFNGKDFVPLLLVQILISVFTSLWSLLFVIPGIIKGYAYSQSFYIYKDLSEHTDTQSLSANNYITESKLLMEGNKGRLFYIDLSFLGWELVSVLTLGIGYLFLEPYKNATKAAFYRDISKDRYLGETEEFEEIDLGSTEEDEWTSF
ncbi:DUF975 family protein [uncultured Vagococcus sp.]|uniref:DUF975 family protein n=1 Tax=uncultured Vagococcus sp. TaxID=189676 RepID=UPI0028D1946B|nr:DUF975 family protein [uncultured Vagococcus sp.]